MMDPLTTEEQELSVNAALAHMKWLEANGKEVCWDCGQVLRWATTVKKLREMAKKLRDMLVKVYCSDIEPGVTYDEIMKWDGYGFTSSIEELIRETVKVCDA